MFGNLRFGLAPLHKPVYVVCMLMNDNNNKMKTRKDRIAESNQIGRWIFHSRMRNCGSDREWAIQRNDVTGMLRYISQSQAGRDVIRYSVPRG